MNDLLTSLVIIILMCTAKASPNLFDEFNGTAIINNFCSASIFRFEKTSLKDYVLLLTNGHCIQMGTTKWQIPAIGEKLFDIHISGIILSIEKIF